MKMHVTAGSLLLLAIVSTMMLPFHPVVNYTATFLLSSALYLLFAFLLIRNEVRSEDIVYLIIAALIVRLAFLSFTPVGSDDVYRYMWDGKVQAQSVNPYRYPPNSPSLEHLATPLLPASVNHPQMTTMYFPLSEWLFAAGYLLSGEQVWGYKALLLSADMLSLYGLMLLLKKRNDDLKYLLLFALCPMVLFEYAVDAHVDGFGLPFMVFGLYHYLSKRKWLGAVLLGLSMSVKPTAVVLLPVLFFEEREWYGRVRAVVVPLAVLAVQFIPYLFTADPFESLKAFTVNWTFNGFVFNAFDLFIRNNQISRLLSGSLLAVIVILLSISQRSFLEKSYYAVLFLLLFSPVVHPWYVGWLAVLVPVVRRWSGIVYTATVSLTSFTFISYQLHGRWAEEPVQWLAEYLPVAAVIVWELRRKKQQGLTA